MKYFTAILILLFLSGCIDTSSTPRSVPLNVKDNINILYTGDLPQTAYKYFLIELKTGTRCIVLRGNNEYNLDCNWVVNNKEVIKNDQQTE